MFHFSIVELEVVHPFCRISEQFFSEELVALEIIVTLEVEELVDLGVVACDSEVDDLEVLARA